MPRKRSAVHDHFAPAADQRDRKIQLVECIHCRHQTAGNNASRLLKHLQGGCWPADDQYDPSLIIPSPEVGAEGPNNNTDGSSLHQQLPEDTNTSHGASNIAPMAPTQVNKTPNRVTFVEQRPHATNSTLRRNPPRPANHSQAVATRSIMNNTIAPTSTQHLLLNVTVKDTKDPAVSRFLSVPINCTFAYLQSVLNVAFSYKTLTGMFDVVYPAWMPGRGRPPKRSQISIYANREQMDRYHSINHENEEETDTGALPASNDERLAINTYVKGLLDEVSSSCKMIWQVGPWSHSLEFLGTVSNSTKPLGQANCLSGEGHPVLETSDSLMWQVLKDAYRTSVATPTQKSYRVYYEKEGPNGDSRGLSGGNAWRWDRDGVNLDLIMLPPVTAPTNMPSSNVGAGVVHGSQGVQGQQMSSNFFATSQGQNAAMAEMRSAAGHNPGHNGGEDGGDGSEDVDGDGDGNQHMTSRVNGSAQQLRNEQQGVSMYFDQQLERGLGHPQAFDAGVV